MVFLYIKIKYLNRTFVNEKLFYDFILAVPAPASGYVSALIKAASTLERHSSSS